MDITIEIEAPETDKEIQLSQIWAKLLNVDIGKIGKQTTFFELGGDSINTIQLIANASSIGIQLDTSTVFKRPTLSQMATCVQSRRAFVVRPLDVSYESHSR